MNSADIISVSEYLDRLNLTLKSEKAKIVGEISEVKRGPTGHVYFSMKDEKDGAVISCIIWSSKYDLYGVELKNGVKIFATGTPNIYPQSGRLSFIADVIELAGEGALQIAYEKLKKKLENEGLFAENRKKLLPNYPHRIGVITSKNGAVINDFLTNIGKFGYEILFVDSRVEGQDAINDLLLSLDTLRKKDIDVLVILRGGGSLESFLAFNNETLVRAVADFPVPVLTGIGHDKDIPLVSLVSDKNVSTPTAVANILNSTWNNALSSVRLSEEIIISQFGFCLKDKLSIIENSQVSIERKFVSLFDTFKNAEKTVINALVSIESRIHRLSDSILVYQRDLFRGYEFKINKAKDTLSQFGKIIETFNPKKQLARGYSIVRHNGKILRSVKNTKKNDKLDISLSDGIIQSQII